MRRWSVLPAVALVLAAVLLSAPEARAQEDELLARIQSINESLRARGLNIAVEAIEAFTIGNGRPGVRIHQLPYRWVANDERRLADGENITYLVNESLGATASGLTNDDTEAAIDRAMSTWDWRKAMKKVALVEREDSGADATIYDAFFGFGGFGDPFLADIVNAGWYPGAFFDAVFGPGGKEGVLAFTVTFIFIDPATGAPSDINGDNYLDTALSEVYYNDYFGDPAGSRAAYPWAIDGDLPAIDVETVALHENGHALELGHFGPPPVAVMNPVYGGIRHVPYAIDDAGMSIVWASWPK